MKNTKDFISVVIPTYNYGRFVCDAVDSVLAQSYAPVEVIVVDDGSKDDTRDRVAKYGSKIKYIFQENKGLSAARNTGIAASGSEFIALLDSDDIWQPDKLKLQIELFRERGDVGLVGTASFTIGEVAADKELAKYVNLKLVDLLRSTPISPSSVLIRKACFHKVGMFDESLKSVEDMDMWLRIGAFFRLMRLNAPLTGLRTHMGSMSTNPTPMLVNHKKVLNKAFSSIPELHKNPSWKLMAKSRMHFGVSWMWYLNGERAKAVQSLVSSFICWPFPLKMHYSSNARFTRIKLLFRYIFQLDVNSEKELSQNPKV